MKSNLIFTLSAACLLTFSACQQASETSVDLAQVKSEIQAAEDAWAAALNARDLDALMALYTDDAVSMTNNAPMMAGKEAIRKNQELEFASVPEGFTYSFEVLDVYGDGNTVTETGTSTYKNADGKVVGTGKYMVVWEKQQDGKYLCASEIYNGDSPSVPQIKSIHLFDLPADVAEADLAAALTETNDVIAELGYPGAGYHLYKTENADTKDYRYYFEGVWPSAAAYTKIHEAPAFVAVSKKTETIYDKIEAVQIYRRMSRVE